MHERAIDWPPILRRELRELPRRRDHNACGSDELFVVNLLRLSRDDLENVEFRSRGDYPGQCESSKIEEDAEFGLRPLPASVADKPAQVQPREYEMPRGGFEALRHYSFDEQKLSARRHRAPAAAKNADAPLVVPVVDNALQKAGVCTDGDRQRTANRRAPLLRASVLNGVLCVPSSGLAPGVPTKLHLPRDVGNAFATDGSRSATEVPFTTSA